MTVPDYESLMPAVLALAGQERSIGQAVAAISDQLALTEDERSIRIPSGGKTLIKSRTEWAITYLVHAGLLTRPRRGHFHITDRGREVLRANPSRIDQSYLWQFPEFRDFLTRRRSAANPTTPAAVEPGNASQVQLVANPEEQIGEAYQTLEAELQADLLQRILKQTPAFFEELVVDLIATMGYGSPETLSAAVGKVGDGGIDGIVYQDKLGLDVVYIQAKRYDPKTNTVGRPEVQAFIGALAGVAAHKGIFVTTSTFSPQAALYVKSVQQRIILIDGERLTHLMITHGVGVRVKQSLHLHRIDEDYFVEE